MLLLFVYICFCASPQSGNGFPSPYTVIVLYHMNWCGRWLLVLLV